jgi:hypothetical protein
MNVFSRPKIVLLGMMTKIPVAGAVWGVMQYLVGFRRLGFDVYYVEAHARTPTMLMQNDHDDASALAAAYIDRVMRRFDFAGKWCFHALHADGRCYGMSDSELKALYREAALIINYHGSTVPLPEHAATGRLVYLETDPVELEIELYHGTPGTAEFLAPHVAFFTWGLNYGQPDCQVPLPAGLKYSISPPAVVPDLWEAYAAGPADTFTTIGNWRQPGQVTFQGDVYTWTKHTEFEKVLDLPRRTGQAFELALSSYDDTDRRLLEERGWRVCQGLSVSKELDPYRDYVAGSRGEFTVAKDQNVRLRSGWFSERSAQYLAAGRPVVTQETGFSNVLPTGAGLFGFTTVDDAATAVDAINGDYERHRRAARAVAREYLAADVVLPRMLEACGVGRRPGRS